MGESSLDGIGRRSYFVLAGAEQPPMGTCGTAGGSAGPMTY